MPVVSVSLALIIFVAGTIAGSLGALLGLGGGVFLVPFLNLVLGFPFSVAAAIMESLPPRDSTRLKTTSGFARNNC